MAVVGGLLRGACVAVLAVAFAGCGGEESGPLVGALGYVPADAASVVVVPTDLESDQVRAFERTLWRRVGGGRGIAETLGEDLPNGVSFDRDIRPLLGNELVFATPRPPARSGRRVLDGAGFLAALDARDGDKVAELLPKLELPPDGEHAGARLFRTGSEAGDASIAVDGNVLLFATDERTLKAAIDRGRGDGGFEESRLSSALEGLPRDALVKVYGDPAALLAERELRGLRKLPWFDALRAAGATVAIDGDEVALDAIVHSDGGRLRDADLPLPPGSEEVPLPQRPDEVNGASANQSQTTVFLLRALRAIRPAGRFAQDVERVERDLAIDFEREVLEQFDGPSASTVAGPDRFAARSTVRDPERMAETLRRLRPHLGRLVQDLDPLRDEGLTLLFLFAPDAPVATTALGESRIDVRRVRGERALYRMENLNPRPDLPEATAGPDQIVFGLLGDVFVVAADEQQARAIARERLAPVEGLSGASVARFRLSAVPGTTAGEGDVFAPEDELRGWVRASRAEVRAGARIRLAGGR